VSSDSSRIAYVTVDLFARGNKLVVADADGGNPQEVVITGPRIPDIKDAPLFSADGHSLERSAGYHKADSCSRLTHPLRACIIPCASTPAVGFWGSCLSIYQLPLSQATSVRTPRAHGEVNDWSIKNEIRNY
jgi:hypothetical protein